RLDSGRTSTRSWFTAGRAARQVLPFRRVRFAAPTARARRPELARFVDPHPFVPSDPATLRERCEEIFNTQLCGLAKRLDHAGRPAPVIGVSGGLDSRLALLVLCKTMDALGEPRSKVKALTMPGYGTTARTLANARDLMRAVGVSAREADIRTLCFDQLKALGHAPFGIPLDGLTPQSLAEKLR